MSWSLPVSVADVLVIRDEVETTLKLLGVRSLDELGPHLLNTRALDGRIMGRL